jgi:hypothetical protein
VIVSEPAFVVLLLLFPALPLGLALTSGLIEPRSRAARLGTATLAGLAALAAAVHALVSLGVPGRIALPALAAAGVAAGAATIARARRSRASRIPPVPPSVGRRTGSLAVEELLPLALVSLLLLQPLADARNFAVHEHDATRIWAPKAVRALDEAPPDLAAEQAHAHPEYPRGLAILTAGPSAVLGAIDPRIPRFVPLLVFALSLLCVFDVLAARGTTAGACAAVAILGSIPFVLRQATSGLADVPMAGFVLLGSAGLVTGRDGRPSVPVALAGALGALVTKDEGLAFAAALLLVLAIRLVRAGRPGSAVAALGVAGAAAAPWIVLRSGAHAGTPLLLGSLLENAGLVLTRCDQMAREIAHLALGLPDPSPDGIVVAELEPGADPVLHAALACGLVLLAGRGRRFPVLPAGLLLLADAGAVVLSDVPVDWQLVTAMNRLVIQVLPVLLVAAIDKLAGAPRNGSRTAVAADGVMVAAGPAAGGG